LWGVLHTWVSQNFCIFSWSICATINTDIQAKFCMGSILLCGMAIINFRQLC
jgi:hypothetical protein